MLVLAAGVAVLGSATSETRVVIAVALAAPVLRERVGPATIAGTALVAGGVALLSVA